MGTPASVALLALSAADKLAAGAQANARVAAQEAANNSRIEAEKAAQASAERRRREALRRAVGTARASYGARGVSAADGSGAALLAGLAREADAESIEERGQHLRRVADLQREIAYGRRVNLLQRAGTFIGIARDIGSFAEKQANGRT